LVIVRDQDVLPIGSDENAIDAAGLYANRTLDPPGWQIDDTEWRPFPARDGSFHSLKVTLAKEAHGSGYQLQARRGYFVQPHAIDPVEQAKQDMEEAFFSRDVLGDLPVELHTQFFKIGASQAKLSILARVDVKHLRYRKADGRNVNTLTVLGGVFDRNGNYVTASQKTIEISLTDERLETMSASGVTVKSTLEVAPGSYIVRLVVRDSEGRLMSTRNSVVEIQ
jgi:hypothetical protein